MGRVQLGECPCLFTLWPPLGPLEAWYGTYVSGSERLTHIRRTSALASYFVAHLTHQELSAAQAPFSHFYDRLLFMMIGALGKLLVLPHIIADSPAAFPLSYLHGPKSLAVFDSDQPRYLRHVKFVTTLGVSDTLET